MELGCEVVGVDGAPGKLRRASAVPDYPTLGKVVTLARDQRPT
jgi:hypothetical protein